jgi:hypothetical protein
MSAPDKALILRVATEEAAAAGAQLGDVLGMAIDGRAIAARRRAMLRIISETQCSPSALARAWGCDPSLPSRYVREESHRQAAAVSAYDLNTRARLHACHPERAASIIAGTDAATNADIAAWRRIGGLA